MAVAVALHQIHICNREEDGSWTCGARVEVAPAVADMAAERLAGVLLSSSGRTLVWRSSQRLIIWHSDGAGD
ncbi:MAG: hypothetical protein OXC07_02470 [Kistimonas sp.]|nr:hypothetical protein [Kistimonas sp.]